MVKRKASVDDGERPGKYAALKPRTRHVAESTVRKRWTTLPDSSQNKVKEILRSGERPAIVMVREEKKRLEAQEIISTVQHSFAQRLPKIPFPPGTKESHFDYESLMESNRSTEAQLTSTTHYNQLLRSEIERRRALLAAEKREHEALERNAKTEKALRKHQTRMLHPVLKKPEFSLQLDDIPSFSKRTPVSLEDDADPTVRRLTQGLLSHLETMQSNTGQLEQVKSALPGLKAILENHSS